MFSSLLSTVLKAFVIMFSIEIGFTEKHSSHPLPSPYYSSETLRTDRLGSAFCKCKMIRSLISIIILIVLQDRSCFGQHIKHPNNQIIPVPLVDHKDNGVGAMS